MLCRSNLTLSFFSHASFVRSVDFILAIGLLQILLKLNLLWDSTSSRSCHVLFCSEDFSFIGPARTVWSYFLLARRSEDDCLRSLFPVLDEQHPRYTWAGHAGNIAAVARNTKSSAWKAKKNQFAGILAMYADTSSSEFWPWIENNIAHIHFSTSTPSKPGVSLHRLSPDGNNEMSMRAFAA